MMPTSVLIVDDDIAASALARGALEKAGYAVAEALNGRRALQQLTAKLSDLVITRILMSDGDGIELITALRAAHPEVRIIAVSDRRFFGDLDLFDLAQQLGANAVLDTPLVADQLLATVARLIELNAVRPSDRQASPGAPARGWPRPENC